MEVEPDDEAADHLDFPICHEKQAGGSVPPDRVRRVGIHSHELRDGGDRPGGRFGSRLDGHLPWSMAAGACSFPGEGRDALVRFLPASPKSCVVELAKEKSSTEETR